MIRYYITEAPEADKYLCVSRPPYDIVGIILFRYGFSSLADDTDSRYWEPDVTELSNLQNNNCDYYASWTQYEDGAEWNATGFTNSLTDPIVIEGYDLYEKEQLESRFKIEKEISELGGTPLDPLTPIEKSRLLYLRETYDE